MPINWNLLQSTDAGGAFQAGFQRGQATRRENDTRGALSALAANPDDAAALGRLRTAAPEVALKMEERLREQRTRGILSRVFAPAPVAPVGALTGQPQPAAAGSVPSVTAMAVPVAMAAGAGAVPTPATLLDPAQLPPRTDGMRVNQEALRELYAADPEQAFKIQQQVYEADAAALKRVQQSGSVMAQAAYRLAALKGPDGMANVAARQAELQAMTPQLLALGLDPQSIATADITDEGLARYVMLGRSIGDLARDERADRQLDWNMEDDRLDNERADRSERRQEHYAARSDARAERQDGRAAVRFRERDKDRAALAGIAGVRTDLSDLDY